MTNQNKQRDIIHKKALKLSRMHRFLCLEWSTGAGKTKAALDIAQDLLDSNPDAVGYLVCKESTHKKNWISDMQKHGKDSIEGSLKTILYASLKSQKKPADFVILDECHALTPKRIQYLRQILQKGTRIVFLSATIPDEKKDLMNALCKNVHYNRIPLTKAFEIGLLPKPNLVIHSIHLNTEITDKVWEFVAKKPKGGGDKYIKCPHDEMYSNLKTLPKGYGLICTGSESEHYNALTNQLVYYEQLSNKQGVPYEVRQGCRFKYLNIASNRKKFIAEVKTLTVKKLVEEFRTDKSRFICFTGSIKQVKELGSTSAIHSKNTNDHNQELIDCFNSLECDELFAVKMLREGVNLTDIEKGIITQLDSGIGSFYQMLGRCLRHEFPEMHLILLQGTQDVKYFNRSMKDFDEEYITWR
jgi:superfamily II DNA or RNA helicase